MEKGSAKILYDHFSQFIVGHEDLTDVYKPFVWNYEISHDQNENDWKIYKDIHKTQKYTYFEKMA